MQTATNTRPAASQITIPRDAWNNALNTIDELADALKALAPANNIDATLALARVAIIRHRLHNIR